MKRATVCFFLFLIIFCFMCTSSCAEEQYFEVAKTEELICYIDIKSIEDRDGSVFALTKVVPMGQYLIECKQIYGENISYLLSSSAYFKKYKRQKILSIIAYDKLNKVIKSDKFDSHEWTAIVPDSIEEKQYDDIMLINYYKQKIKIN